MVEDPVQTTRVKKCAKRPIVFEKNAAVINSKEKVDRSAYRVKSEHFNVKPPETFFNEVFFFPSDIKISFSLFQKP